MQASVFWGLMLKHSFVWAACLNKAGCRAGPLKERADVMAELSQKETL